MSLISLLKCLAILFGCVIFSAGLPVTLGALSLHAQQLHGRVKQFIDELILPLESDFARWAEDPRTKWLIHPQIEQLKVIIELVSRGLTQVYN